MNQTNIDGVDVYYFRISEKQNKVSMYTNILMDDEIEKARRFHYKKDKDNYIICRGALRNLISSSIDINPQEIIFKYNSFGKPELSLSQNIKGLKFNLSHSGDLCLIAVTNDLDIGVDIEKVSYIENCSSIAQNFFSESEIMLLRFASNDERQELFYNLWTQKEALVKASGKGLTFGMDHWSINPRSGKHKLKIYNTEYTVIPFKIHNDYQSALCLAGNSERSRYG